MKILSVNTEHTKSIQSISFNIQNKCDAMILRKVYDKRFDLSFINGCLVVESKEDNDNPENKELESILEKIAELEYDALPEEDQEKIKRNVMLNSISAITGFDLD